MFFYFGKFHLKLSKIKLHLKSFKSCKQEKIIPKFIKFKIPSTGAIKRCYEEILVNEIKNKKLELTCLYHDTKSFISQMNQDMGHLTNCRIHKVIEKFVAQDKIVISNRHSKRLTKLRSTQKPVTNSTK